MSPSKYTYPTEILGDQPSTLKLFLIVSDFLIIVRPFINIPQLFFFKVPLEEKELEERGADLPGLASVGRRCGGVL